MDYDEELYRGSDLEINNLEKQLEEKQKEVDRLNKELEVSPYPLHTITRLEGQLKEAIDVINLMRVNMKYIEPEYDELDIKVTAFLKRAEK